MRKMLCSLVWYSSIISVFVIWFGGDFVAQLVKNLPATLETWIDPWVGKIPCRRERHPPQDSCLENPMDCSELDTTE